MARETFSLKNSQLVIKVLQTQSSHTTLFDPRHQWRSEKFKKKRGGHNFQFFFSSVCFFFGSTRPKFKLTEKTRKAPRESEGHTPPEKFLKTSHAVMAIFIAFLKQFARKFCLNFFGPNSECFAKYDAILFAHFRLMRA